MEEVINHIGPGSQDADDNAKNHFVQPIVENVLQACIVQWVWVKFWVWVFGFVFVCWVVSLFLAGDTQGNDQVSNLFHKLFGFQSKIHSSYEAGNGSLMLFEVSINSLLCLFHLLQIICVQSLDERNLGSQHRSVPTFQKPRSSFYQRNFCSVKFTST